MKQFKFHLVNLLVLYVSFWLFGLVCFSFVMFLVFGEFVTASVNLSFIFGFSSSWLYFYLWALSYDSSEKVDYSENLYTDLIKELKKKNYCRIFNMQ